MKKLFDVEVIEIAKAIDKVYFVSQYENKLHISFKCLWIKDNEDKTIDIACVNSVSIARYKTKPINLYETNFQIAIKDFRYLAKTRKGIWSVIIDEDNIKFVNNKRELIFERIKEIIFDYTKFINWQYQFSIICDKEELNKISAIYKNKKGMIPCFFVINKDNLEIITRDNTFNIAISSEIEKEFDIKIDLKHIFKCLKSIEGNKIRISFTHRNGIIKIEDLGNIKYEFYFMPLAYWRSK